MDMPTNVNTNKIRVEEKQYNELLETRDFDEAAARALANHYSRYGDGQVAVTITYDPKSSTNTASTASMELGRVLGALRAYGIDDVKGDILPVNERDSSSRILIGYTSYTAHAPDGCDVMQGVNNNAANVDWNYKLGCTIDIMTARQVARPKDLLGNDRLTSGDAAREGERAMAIRTGGGDDDE